MQKLGPWAQPNTAPSRSKTTAHAATSSVVALPTRPRRTLRAAKPQLFKLSTQAFLTGEEVAREELVALVKLAADLKQHRKLYRAQALLPARQLGLLFEKPSLRTRVSFTVAINELGGQAIEITSSNTKKELPQDQMRVLNGYLDGLMVRTFDHSILETMGQHAKIPLINGLSDQHHPCQALADVLTILEKWAGNPQPQVAYVGDGNNILHSLLLVAPAFGINVTYACPEGFDPDPAILARAKARAQEWGTSIEGFRRPVDAVIGAHAVYTDVWTSMGFEEENEKRLKAFEGFKVSEDLLTAARPGAIAMHCLPMVRDLEISGSLADSKASALWEQSENRLHVQKALLLSMMND